MRTANSHRVAGHISDNGDKNIVLKLTFRDTEAHITGSLASMQKWISKHLL